MVKVDFAFETDTRSTYTIDARVGRVAVVCVRVINADVDWVAVCGRDKATALCGRLVYIGHEAMSRVGIRIEVEAGKEGRA